MLTARKKKRNLKLQSFFIIALYACCLYRIFTAPITTNNETQNVILSFLNTTLFQRLISYLLLIINALTIRWIMRRQGLIELKNYYPILFYLLLSVIFSAVLNPLALFAGLVFIFGIFRNLFGLEEANIKRKVFRYGFWVGVLTLMHFPFLLLLFFIYSACIIYRRFSFRIFLLPIVGVLLPFLYWYSALYIIGSDFSFQENILQMKESLLSFQFFNIIETPFILIITILLLLTGLWLIQTLLVTIGKTSVLRRKKYYILLVLFLFSIAFAFLYAPFYLEIVLVVYAIVISLDSSIG